MNLLQRLKRYFSGGISVDETTSLSEPSEMVSENITESKGRIITKTRRAEYTPEHRSGGRVVKAMPKQLQRIKEAQEKTEE